MTPRCCSPRRNPNTTNKFYPCPNPKYCLSQVKKPPLLQRVNQTIYKVRNVLNGTYPTNPKKPLPGFIVSQIVKIKAKIAGYVNTLAQKLADRLGLSTYADTQKQAKVLVTAIGKTCASTKEFIGVDFNKVSSDLKLSASKQVTAASTAAAARIAATEGKVKRFIMALAGMCTKDTLDKLTSLTAVSSGGNYSDVAAQLGALDGSIADLLNGLVDAGALSSFSSIQNACQSVQDTFLAYNDTNTTLTLLRMVNSSIVNADLPKSTPNVLKGLDRMCSVATKISPNAMTNILVVVKIIQAGGLKKKNSTSAVKLAPPLPPPSPALAGRRALLQDTDTTATTTDSTSGAQSSSAASSESSSTSGMSLGSTTGGFTSTSDFGTDTGTTTTTTSAGTTTTTDTATDTSSSSTTAGGASSSTAQDTPPAPTVDFFPGVPPSVPTTTTSSTDSAQGASGGSGSPAGASTRQAADLFSPPAPAPSPSPYMLPPTVVLRAAPDQGQQLIRLFAPPTVSLGPGAVTTVAPNLIQLLQPVCAVAAAFDSLPYALVSGVQLALDSLQPNEFQYLTGNVTAFMTTLNATCANKQLAGLIAQSRIQALKDRVGSACAYAGSTANFFASDPNYAAMLSQTALFRSAKQKVSTACDITDLFGRVDTCSGGAIATLNATLLLQPLLPKVKGGGPLALLNASCQGVANLRTLNSCTQGKLLGMSMRLLNAMDPGVLNKTLTESVRPALDFLAKICASGQALAPNATGAVGVALSQIAGTCSNVTKVAKYNDTQLLAWLKQQSDADKINGPLGPLSGTCSSLQRMTPDDVKALVKSFIQQNKKKLIAATISQAWKLFVAQVTQLIKGKPYGPLVRTAMGFAGGQLEDSLSYKPPPPDPYFMWLGGGGKCRKNHYGPVCAVCLPGTVFKGKFCGRCKPKDAWVNWTDAQKGVFLAFMAALFLVIVVIGFLKPLIPAFDVRAQPRASPSAVYVCVWPCRV